MVLKWFDTREVDEFADSIAADLISHFPLSELEDQKRKGPSRLKKTHDAIFARAEVFAITQHLNLYKKARLGNRFKWALKEAGYPADFVDSFTYELITFVTVKSGRRGKTGSERAPGK
jgi:hypothetical protein